MFCADSSSWVAYLSGSLGDDVEIIEAGLRDQSIRMAPMVISEILRDPLLPPAAEKSLLAIPMLDLVPGFWERAGKTRANLIKWKCKPKLADTLIAQVCIDHNVTLHARDTHFRPFAKYARLQLVLHGVLN
jgi:predicted nucleic acid-binding protein